MTDLELLSACINELGGINVPAVLIESVGIPVLNVRAKLINLFNAIKEKDSNNRKSENTEPENNENPVLVDSGVSDTSPEE